MKLYEHDPLQSLFELGPWGVLGLMILALMILGGLGVYDFQTTGHHGDRHGLFYFWTVTFGDTLILPITVALITAFYQTTSVRGDSFLISKGIYWSLILATFLVTIGFVMTRATTQYETYEGGDWTTTPDGGLNTYGFIHAVFFWGIAYVWAAFLFRSAVYLVTGGDFSTNAIVYTVVAWALILFFLLFLGPKDNKSPAPFWNWLVEHDMGI